MRGGRFPRIMPEALAELRSRIGQPVDDEPFARVATEDAIRNYALGIGDPNSMWLDREYAKKTRWQSLLAPPTFLYATSRVVSGYVGGLPGIHAMFAGSHWRWFEPVVEGCRITSRAVLKDLILRETEFAGRAVQQIYQVDFYSQKAITWPPLTPGVSARREIPRAG